MDANQFQSYLTGIEIMEPDVFEDYVAGFQSYLTGIEMVFAVTTANSGYSFQSYLTGIEIGNRLQTKRLKIVPIVPNWN